MSFNIRIHLNPEIKVSLSLDKKKAILILNDQGWIFNFEGNAELLLEPSINVLDNGEIINTNQIILKGETIEENTQILWGLRLDAK